MVKFLMKGYYNMMLRTLKYKTYVALKTYLYINI